MVRGKANSDTLRDESLDAYFGTGAGRPAWALWGKARPGEDAAVPAHPLLCHMIDVAAVAEAMLESLLPRGTLERLLRPLGVPPEDARRWLTLFVALHDLGKASPAFQRKWEPAVPYLVAAGFDLDPPFHARDHGTVGPLFIEEAASSLGVHPDLAFRVGRSVAAHHGSFPTDRSLQVPPLGRAERGRNAAWDAARREIVTTLARLFVSGVAAPQQGQEDWAFLSAFAGLTAVADWLGSMAEIFCYEAPPADASDYLKRARARAGVALAHAGFRPPAAAPVLSFRDLFGFDPRPLQSAAEQLVETASAPLCAIVEAPMGEGKTEAALFLAHALAAAGTHDGVYIGLPTQATANQMFDRLAEFLERTRPDQRTNLSLLHGEAVFDVRVQRLLRAVYGSQSAGLVCEGWFLSAKRALLAPFGVGTVDQALLSVLRTKHAFVRQFGLAGKTVVLDEVHAYDAYTSTLLDRLIAWLARLGASVIILSATLPSERRRALLEAYAGTPVFVQTPTYPRLVAVHQGGVVATTLEGGRPQSVVRVDWLDDVSGDLVAAVRSQLEQGGCIAVLRNTVRRAQETYAALRALKAEGAVPDGTELLLLHARFPVADRAELERRLIGRLGKSGMRPTRMVVVGTQVLEQSLDVDFDWMISDVAPADLVLQRAGRIHRHAGRFRPPGTERPTITLVAPSGDPANVDVSPVAGVYVRYLVRRSLLVLRGRTELVLPADIEALVEAVYTGPEPPTWREALAADREAFEQERAREEGLAETRVWRSPTVVDDPFGDLHMELEEDDPQLAWALRAETRLGDPTAEIVCLFGAHDDAYLDKARTLPIDLAAEPSRDMVRALAGRTVKVSTRGLVPKLMAQQPPMKWRDVNVLARRRPIFFGGAPVVIDDFTLELDRDLGLLIQRQPKGAKGAVSPHD